MSIYAQYELCSLIQTIWHPTQDMAAQILLAIFYDFSGVSVLSSFKSLSSAQRSWSRAVWPSGALSWTLLDPQPPQLPGPFRAHYTTSGPWPKFRLDNNSFNGCHNVLGKQACRLPSVSLQKLLERWELREIKTGGLLLTSSCMFIFWSSFDSTIFSLLFDRLY